MEGKHSILLVCGGGGFSWEGKVIALELMARGRDVVLVHPGSSYESREFFENHNAYESVRLTSREGYSYLRLIKGFLSNLFLAAKIVRKHDCGVIIGAGDSSSIPFLLAGKILNKKTVFVESPTRTRELSRTCRIACNLHLADEVLVQWPKMSSLHKRLAYKGNIL